MVGNFRLANRFATVMSRYIYDNVYFDRFNSVYKGFYLVVGEAQLAEMIRSNSPISFVKIHSTERFGSQDITQLEYFDQNYLTPEQRNMIFILNSAINTGRYLAYEEY